MNPLAIIKIIATISASITSLQELSVKLYTNLKQNAELTPEQEAELDGYIKKVQESPWWKPNV